MSDIGLDLYSAKNRQIKKAHHYAFKRYFKEAKLSLQKTKIKHLGTNIATVHICWQLAGQTGISNEVAEPRRGVMLIVARRHGETWRAVAAQNTDIAPGAETNLFHGERITPVHYTKPKSKLS